MAAALLTLTGVSVLGIAAAIGLAYTATSSVDVSNHVLMGVFGTFLNLLAHSLMIFYLVGKGKAVREAVAENALGGDYVARVRRAHTPVHARATYAMAATMTTAIMGASVDTRVMPGWPHAVLAAVAVALNLWAMASEIAALRTSSGVVDEVNRRIPGAGE